MLLFISCAVQSRGNLCLNGHCAAVMFRLHQGCQLLAPGLSAQVVVNKERAELPYWPGPDFPLLGLLSWSSSCNGLAVTWIPGEMGYFCLCAPRVPGAAISSLAGGADRNLVSVEPGSTCPPGMDQYSFHPKKRLSSSSVAVLTFRLLT